MNLPKFPLLEVEDPRDTDPTLNHLDLVLRTLEILKKAKINDMVSQQYLNEALYVEEEEIRAVTERWVTIKKRSHITLVK